METGDFEAIVETDISMATTSSIQPTSTISPTIPGEGEPSTSRYTLRRSATPFSSDASMDTASYSSSSSSPKRRKQSHEEDTPFFEQEEVQEKLRDFLLSMGCEESNPNSLKKTMANVQKSLIATIFQNEYPPHDDGAEMIEQLLEKYEITDRKTKIKILSVLPKSWSVNKVHKTFDASRHIAQKTKDMVEQHGVLFEMRKRIGTNRLSDETAKKVTDFYRRQDISSFLSGQR